MPSKVRQTSMSPQLWPAPTPTIRATSSLFSRCGFFSRTAASARLMASLKISYRKEKYDFAKCIYVTGLEQSLHFKQVFKAIEVMGYDWADSLVHVPYGLVSLDGEKLSTRNGNIIYAEDILREAIRRAGAFPCLRSTLFARA